VKDLYNLSESQLEELAQSIAPSNIPPIADFSFSPPHPKAWEVVDFFDASTDPDGQIVGWDWDFGDSQSSRLRNPSHVYREPGTYSVTLTVTDNQGAKGSTSKIIEVQAGRGLAAAPWPMIYHDSRHTGQSPLEGPDEPLEVQVVALPKPSSDTGPGTDVGAPSSPWPISLLSSPAIGPDGTVYLHAGSKLYALSPDGVLLWEAALDPEQATEAKVATITTTAAGLISSPAVGADGTIYLGSGSKFYAIDPNGIERWSLETYSWWDEKSGLILSSPAIAKDGAIYVGAGCKILAVDPDGGERWEFITGNLVLSSPAIGSDGTIYVGSFDGKLYALNPASSLRWTFDTGWWIESSPAVGEDGTIYITSGLKLYALNPDGEMRWAFTAEDLLTSPVIGQGKGRDEDEAIYVGSWDGTLYAIDPDGEERWSFTVEGMVLLPPVIDVNGTIYVSSSTGKLYALNPDGTTRWEISISEGHRRTPFTMAIGPSKTLYLSDGETLYMVK